MPNHGRREGAVVAPLSEDKIAAFAGDLRRLLGLEAALRFPVVEMYEMLWLIDESAAFDVVEDHLLPEDDALTHPDRHLILVRQSVYDAAARGQGRARFTLAHELGHLALHKGAAFARVNPERPPKIYCNSEWQADVFASHLLMPAGLLAMFSDDAIAAEVFGVSRAAASVARKRKKGS